MFKDMKHIVRIVVMEAEAVSVVVIPVIRKNAVSETAGLADKRNGTVAHGDHLRKSARLELRRHQIDIARGIDAAGDLLVMAEAADESAGESILCVAESILKILIAGSDDDHLHVHAHDVVQNTGDQIETLLRGKPRDETDQRNVTLLQPQFFLQCSLVELLPGGIRRIIMNGNMHICARIERYCVYSVQDAGQDVLSCAKQTVETFAEISGTDLLGIGRADGRDAVCEDETRLHKRQQTVELEVVR